MGLLKNKGQLLVNTFKGLWERPDVPHKVRARLGAIVTVQANPNDATPDALTSTLLESRVETNRTDEVVKTNSSLGGPTATFAGQKITSLLQLGTVTETFSSTASISPDALTVDGSTEDLGNGKFFASQTEVGSVLPLHKYESLQESLLPAVFRVSVPTTITEITDIGSASQLTLTGNQTEAVQQELNAFHRRTTIKDIGAVVDGTVFTGLEHVSQYGGGIVAVSQTKAGSNALSLDFKTVEARSVALGDGTFVVDQKELVGSAWPVLTKTEWDPFIRAFVQIQTQVIAFGTGTTSLSGSTIHEVAPIDDLHDLQVITTIVGGTPAGYTIPTLVYIQFLPAWFTSGPTQVDATSGAIADHALAYVMATKRGAFAGTIARSFSTSAPSFPSGTLLRFNESATDAVISDTNTGAYQYARTTVLRTPMHVSAEPSGSHLYAVQTHEGKYGLFVTDVTTIDIT